MTNDLESRSEVIQGHTFWRQSKARVYDFINHNRPSIVTFALHVSSTVSDRYYATVQVSTCMSA